MFGNDVIPTYVSIMTSQTFMNDVHSLTCSLTCNDGVAWQSSKLTAWATVFMSCLRFLFVSKAANCNPPDEVWNVCVSGTSKGYVQCIYVENAGNCGM